MPNPSALSPILSRLAGQTYAPKLRLPDIPDGYVRLTHVMPDRSRDILSSGEPFLYGKHGLDGTTDSYSRNDDVEWLVRTGDPMGVPADGKASNWSRNEFGNHVAIIDLPAEAHKRIVTNTGGYREPIPNAAILGFVDRRAMAFAPNPRYDRAAIDNYGRNAVDAIRKLLAERGERPMFGIGNLDEFDIPPPQPDFSQRGGPDVW